MTNIITQLMPGFAQGCTQLQQALMYVAALLCVAGLNLGVWTHMSQEEKGWIIVRLLVVVILIGNITTIGTVINNIATGVMNAPGFNQNMNMLQDYQTALITKFKIINQPGNNNPFQWLTASVDMIGSTMLSGLVFLGSMIACCMMFFVTVLQQILFLLQVAMSPLFLACIMIRPLVSLATRWATFFVAICIFPLGFRIVDLLMKGALDNAVNTSGNVGITAINVAGGSMFWWVAVALIAFFGYGLAGIYIGWSIVSNGSHGFGVLKAAFTSILMGTLGAAMMAGRLGGAAASAMTPPQASPSAVPQPYRNYATRP